MAATPQQSWGTAAAGRLQRRPRRARFLESLLKVQRGEGRSVLLFGTYAFLLLVAWYILRTLREPLLLVDASAATKTYASAAAALALLFLVPLYGVAFRRVPRGQLVRWVTGFFLATFGVLYLAGRGGADIGFVYYVWVGIFGVTIVAQFWAYAADVFDPERGERLFPTIMAGATLGGLAGPLLFRGLHGSLSPWSLMLVAMAVLALTLPLVGWTRASVQGGSYKDVLLGEPAERRPLGGFSLILRDRYLLLIALLIVLLNCVNTMGEFLLAELVIRHADESIALQPSLDKGALIGEFYANYALAVNALTVLAQLFLVARVFRWIGVHGALLVLPVIALVGYGLVAFLPIFAILRVVKIVENSGDYSVMNTARQALFLRLPTAAKYEGKIATDTFFWRFGDLVPGAIVFVGVHWLDFEFRHFALLNVALSLAWLAVAVRIADSQHSAGRARWSIARALTVWARYLPATPQIRFAPSAAAWLAATLGLGALMASAPADADLAASSDTVRGNLFERHEPLSMELLLDFKALCRDPRRKRCENLPATLVYREDDGAQQHVSVELRARGRYRAETGDCALPALFVFFTGDTRGTLFEGEEMLPLTTHCQRRSEYEQYVLKEYLAYRVYNLLTPKSLRVRLLRVTYRDTAGRAEPFERYAFFTEHFDSLARRHDAAVWTPESFDPLEADPAEMATFDLFQYMIGNTDWSVVYRHNVVLIKDAGGMVTAAPYDLDFSGLVDAEYASVAPELPIRNVRQRLFRGICRPDLDWDTVFGYFAANRTAVLAIARELADVEESHRADVNGYLEDAFARLASPNDRTTQILDACRGPKRSKGRQ